MSRRGRRCAAAPWRARPDALARVTFVLADGARRVLEAAPGRTVLEIAWEHGIGIEGACEGAMACSTCHVVLSEGDFDRLPAPSADEEDMLDVAWGVTPTSRLGCQIVVTDAEDGLVLRLPPETVNHMGL